MKTTLRFAALALLLLALAPARGADAKPFLHPLFSAGAVLQRDAKVPVWGWAEAGEKIAVAFAGQQKTAVAGADGRWTATLDPMPVSAEPRELVVSRAGGGEPVKVANVLVGDVWICSGQSNMEMGLGACNVPGEIAAANFPQIRLLTVPRAVRHEPIPTADLKWLECSPANLGQGVWGGFSAAGFFFGRELHQALHIPVGLIHASWGGTICEAWTSAGGLAPLPEFQERVAQVAKTAEAKRAGGAVDEKNANTCTVLFNGMIAPLLPFAIKGAIWYQGESNAGRAHQYVRLLPAMISDWRAQFGVGDFPFYIVSLANFQQGAPEPRNHDWAELREAQMLTAKNCPHCGLALAIDIGDAKDIHPKNKLELGHRLALAALAQTYGQKVEFSGPWYRAMKVEGGKIRLQFDHADGLVAKGEKLAGFAVAGEDKKFVWADAAIDGASVVVSSAQVAHPVAVRYGWDCNPTCNLYNAAGLPAVPFRTDDWPGQTDKNL